MLIFSHFNKKMKFLEIKNIQECNHITTDICAFFRINDYGDIEHYFALAQALQHLEIHYGVVIEREGFITINNSSLENLALKNLQKDKANICKNPQSIPLNLALVMFADLHAQYFMLDSNNYDKLSVLQGIANYYLLDTKILAIVNSYIEAQYLSYFAQTNTDNTSYIGIDGIIERGLLKQ